MELVLGTAQLGMNYGVNNISGKPSFSEGFNILKKAFENGVNMVNTALAYGNSELIIGEFMSRTNRYFKIATKLPKLKYCENLKDQVEAYIEKSLNNLRVKKIDYYFLHSFEDYKNNIEIIKILKQNQENGKVQKIGVSIYDTYELDYILNNSEGFIDIVQIPFNIFDLRWIKDSILERTKEKGIEVFVRSIYLQGLLFLKKDALDKIHPKTYQYVSKLLEFAEENNMDISNLAMQYIKSHTEINYVLVGCETEEQIDQNIRNFYSDYTDKYKLIKEFAMKNYTDVEKEIIDPRLWKC